MQANFFFQCGWQSVEYGILHPVFCGKTIQMLESIFGMAASVAIGIIVGIFTFFSPKKGAIIVGSIVGFFVLFRLLNQIWFSSLPVSIPGSLHPVNFAERAVWILVRSPLWLYVFISAVFSAIAWIVVVLRKKLLRLLR